MFMATDGLANLLPILTSVECYKHMGPKDCQAFPSGSPHIARYKLIWTIRFKNSVLNNSVYL